MSDLAAWYQKKISSYDKQEWEMQVERWIVPGFLKGPLLASELPSDLIDVDLVRGSSFAKRKPVQGPLRTLWLGLARAILLPLKRSWWSSQTSPRTARILLLLWIMQTINILVYVISPADSNLDFQSIIVPLCLMLGLSVVHSQIVSTSRSHLTNNSRTTKANRPPRRSRSTQVNRERITKRERYRTDSCEGASAESGATSNRDKTKGSWDPRRKVSVSSGLIHNIGNILDKDVLRKRIKCDPPQRDISSIIKRPFKSSHSDSMYDWSKKGKLRRAPTVTFNDTEDDLYYKPRARRKPKYSNTESDSEPKSIDEIIEFRKRKVHRLDYGRRLQENGDDDGFESLNGYNSNASDQPPNIDHENSKESENKLAKTSLIIPASLNTQISNSIGLGDLAPEEEPQKFPTTNNEPLQATVNPKLDANCQNSTADKVIGIETLHEDRRSSVLPDEIHASIGEDVKIPEMEYCRNWLDERNGAPTAETNKLKRSGKSFRNSWVQEMILDPGRKVTESSGVPGPSRMGMKGKRKKWVSSSSEAEGDDTTSAPSVGLHSHLTASDWVGQSTNSEECSYSTEISDSDCENQGEEWGRSSEWRWTDSAWKPRSMLNPDKELHNDVWCNLWRRDELMRAELSVVDISWVVVAGAEKALRNGGGALYLYAVVPLSALLASVVPVGRITSSEGVSEQNSDLATDEVAWFTPEILCSQMLEIFFSGFGDNGWELSVNIIAWLLRFALSILVFFLLAVAERAFKQRFLYAKLFSHLTSSRRARKSHLPHFRLNKVKNIKVWLSVRSYLRRRGPQRSVDVIVSAAFIVTLMLLAFLSAEFLRETVTVERSIALEASAWCCCLGVYLLRFMTLGTSTNRKYRGCTSALITEQMNLHLAMEQRPANKEELQVANNVLKLAADLLKELESPFKISGMSANPYLYNITKVVILSALSGVLSEMLGFKLKLHKIKIK